MKNVNTRVTILRIGVISFRVLYNGHFNNGEI